MAVTLGNNGNSGNQAASAGFSFAHTTAPNTTCLVVAVVAEDAVDANRQVTSVNWNTTETFTEAIEANYVSYGTVTILRLLSPTIKLDNVAVVMAGVCDKVAAYVVDLLGTPTTGDPVTATAQAAINPALDLTIPIDTGDDTAGHMTIGCVLNSQNNAVDLWVTTGTELSEINHLAQDTSSFAYRADNGEIIWTQTTALLYAVAAATFDAEEPQPIPTPDLPAESAEAPSRRTRGFDQRLGLSVDIYDISVDMDTPSIDLTRFYLYRVTDWLQSLSFTTQANGGYWSADIAIRGSNEFIEEWLDRGLGRHVVIRNPALEVVWEGEVNAVEATMGSLSITRGPLHDVVNRVSVAYTRVIDPSSDPPILGNQTVTAIVENNSSQNNWGVLESVLSGGTVETDTAEQMRDTFLEENKRPQTSERLTVGQSGQQPQVTLRCLGYVHRFKKYIIAFTTTGTTTIQTKLIAVLDADPNGLLSTASQNEIDDNAWLTTAYDYENRTAWNVIEELVSIGDVNDDRYTFGVYEGRKSRYEQPMHDDTAYEHRIAQRSQVIETLSHGLVEPWDVQPAKWMFLPDFLANVSRIADRRNDPRYIFIESVTFTAPYTVAINGIKVERLPQLLAKHR